MNKFEISFTPRHSHQYGYSVSYDSFLFLLIQEIILHVTVVVIASACTTTRSQKIDDLFRIAAEKYLYPVGFRVHFRSTDVYWRLLFYFFVLFCTLLVFIIYFLRQSPYILYALYFQTHRQFVRILFGHFSFSPKIPK